MARYNSQGWHFQTQRHSNARKTGRAGGVYAKTFNINSEKGIKQAEKAQQLAYKKYDVVKVEPSGTDKVKITGKNNDTRDKIKGGISDNIDPKYYNQLELSKGIKVELEHTNNPKTAREIATDHLSEDPKYYQKLEKMEGKNKPIKIKITKEQIMKDKNDLEKDLTKEINKTKNIVMKKKLEKIREELRIADTHSKFKRFMDEYGNVLGTIGLSAPFYILAPLATAGVIIETAMLENPDMTSQLIRMSMPITITAIGTMGIKYSIRTVRAIKKREKEIIIEKTKELKDNTTLPDKEIKIIAKRVAQQELNNTKLVHELTTE